MAEREGRGEKCLRRPRLVSKEMALKFSDWMTSLLETEKEVVLGDAKFAVLQWPQVQATAKANGKGNVTAKNSSEGGEGDS